MGATKAQSSKELLRGGLWLLVLVLAIAGGIQASVMADEWREEGGPETPEVPHTPVGPSPEEGEDSDALPGRDDPEEFYKPPPRPQKRITKLPA